MRIVDIRALRGEAVATEVNLAEAFAGSRYGGNDPVVKVTVVEAPVTVTMGYRAKEKPGARVRLEETFRVAAGDGFRELPVGYEFEVESRMVKGAWGKWRDGSRPKDEELLEERAARYAEQDAIRVAFARMGMPQRGGFDEPGYVLKGGEVIIDRALLAVWLNRTLGLYDELTRVQGSPAGGQGFLPMVELPAAAVSAGGPTDEAF